MLFMLKILLNFWASCFFCTHFCVLSVSTDNDRYLFLRRGKFPSCKEGNSQLTSPKKSINTSNAGFQPMNLFQRTLNKELFWKSFFVLPNLFKHTSTYLLLWQADFLGFFSIKFWFTFILLYRSVYLKFDPFTLFCSTMRMFGIWPIYFVLASVCCKSSILATSCSQIYKNRFLTYDVAELIDDRTLADHDAAIVLDATFFYQSRI